MIRQEKGRTRHGLSHPYLNPKERPAARNRLTGVVYKRDVSGRMIKREAIPALKLAFTTKKNERQTRHAGFVIRDRPGTRTISLRKEVGKPADRAETRLRHFKKRGGAGNFRILH